MFTVTKFGGSSLSDAKQFAKVKNIVLSSPKRTVVVCSALGRRDKSDTKITDLLYILHAHLKFSVPYDSIWDMIYTRFIGVQQDLNIKYDIKEEASDDVKEGYVIRTSPKAGKTVKKGSEVTLVVSTGKEEIEIEDYTDKEYENNNVRDRECAGNGVL